MAYVGTYRALLAGGVARPALVLDFIGLNVLDRRITFSRGSNATLTDSTGKITYAPANLLLRSQEFDSASWGKITGGTATAPVVTPDAAVAPDGSMTADLIAFNTVGSSATDISYINQGVTSFVGNAVSSIYLKTADGSTKNLRLRCGAPAPVNITVTGTWTRFYVLSSSATIDRFQLANYGSDGNTTANILVWGAQLEPVTYQTTPSTYQATTSSAYYGPRFDYDPVTLAAKGLLIEEQRANLLLRSEEFDNAAWSKTDVTVTANNTTSPDGTANADLITDGSAGTAALFQSATVTVASPVTVSIFVKRGNADWLLLQLGGAGTERLRGWFNLATGAVGSVANVSPATGAAVSIVNVGNGWYRCTLSGTLNGAGTTCQMLSFMASADASTTRVNNATRYFWGAQLEAGSFATSYIPTVASTATRSADVATMTGSNFSAWYNQAQGTFVVSLTPRGVPTGGASVRFLEVNNGTVTSRNPLMFAGSSGIAYTQYRVAGVDQAQLSSSPSYYAANSTIAVGTAYATNDFATSFSGGAVATDTTGSTVTNASELDIGYARSSGSEIFCGHIRSLQYYNVRLPNAQLQSLTA